MSTIEAGLARPRFRGSLAASYWVLAGGLLAALLVLVYAENLRFLLGYFQQPEYSHGYLIPLITGFFLWHRRKSILQERAAGSWWGVAIAVIALLVFSAGIMAFMVRLAALSFVFLLLGIGFASLGTRAMRRVTVPILFLLTAMPLPGIVFVLLSNDLQLISSQIGGWVIARFDIPVFTDGNIIDLGVYKLQVAEACSGLRYLMPLLAFAVLCAWLMRAPWWMRGLMIVSAVPLTIILNSLRIAVIGLFVHFGNIHLAEGFLHLFEGWVVFVIALTILFGEMWLLCRLRGERIAFLDVLDFERINGPSACPTAVQPSSPPLTLWVVVALLGGMALIQQVLQDRSQYLPPRPGLAALPLVYDGWRGSVGSVDLATTRQLDAADHLLADFQNESGELVNLWIAYYDEQIRDTAIHSPKECLPGGGWEYADLTTIPVPLPDAAVDFKINRAVITKDGKEMLMYYWLDMRGRKLTNELVMKVVNLYDSIVYRRSDGALIRLITAVGAGESMADAESRMQNLLARLYPHLEPHVGR